MVAVGKLAPHPQNPRRGDVDLIGALIQENGFFGAVVAQRSTGHILAGNHRYLAFQAQGAEVIPTIWVDVDDERALKILLSDNRASDIGGYDSEALAALLSSLGGEFEGTGYDTESLDKLLADVARGQEPLARRPKVACEACGKWHYCTAIE